MGGVGRYFCVALPFILTIGSIIAALVVGLTGVTSNDLYLFRIDITNLTVSGGELQGLINDASSLFSGHNASSTRRDVANDPPLDWHDYRLLAEDNGNSKNVEDTVQNLGNALQNTNITASELGLANIYDFTLWGFCVTPQDGKRNCTKAQFDWASHELNTSWVDQLGNDTGFNVTLPKDIKDGLDLYKTVTKWTEIVFIIAIVALGLELVVGLFTACSRAVSCITWLISGFATAAIIATAVLLTVTGSTVLGVVYAAAHKYGVKTSLNTAFLAVLWLSVAFAIGAGLFWLFSICCCKPENRPHKRSSHGDGEKLIPSGAYAPLDEHAHPGYNPYNFGAPQRGGARSDLAYEPYSHARA
ncbi:SUR7 protein [Xylaria intraflava]|nr:SUR7 protein [Xylaria intraflava]